MRISASSLYAAASAVLALCACWGRRQPGRPGAGLLHRIDAALVRQEVASAGLVFVAASELLRNADDPHTAKVFEMQGKSDRFLLKLVKPRH